MTNNYIIMTNEILIPILLSVIAFWLIRYIQRSDKRLDYFTSKIEDLTTQIVLILDRYDSQNVSCDKHHESIEKRFEKNENHIQDHEIRLTKMEEKR